MNQENAMLGNSLRCGYVSSGCYDIRCEDGSLNSCAREAKRMIE